MDALLQIVRRGEIPNPFEWHPREVLELARWSEPNPYQDDRSMHRQRAFASTVLLMGSPQLENAAQITNDPCTAIQLIESVRVLGRDYELLAAGLLCWLLLDQSHLVPGDERPKRIDPFLGVGLVATAARQRVKVTEPELEDTLNWLVTLEQAVRDQPDNFWDLPQWLIGLYEINSWRHREKWQSLLVELAGIWPSFALLV